MHARRPLFVLGGTLFGFMTSYLLTNRDLRRELKEVHSPVDAMKTVGRHLQEDADDMVTGAREAAIIAGMNAKRMARSLVRRFSSVSRTTEEEMDDVIDRAKTAKDRISRSARRQAEAESAFLATA